LFADYQQVTQNIVQLHEKLKKQKKRAELFWDFAPLKKEARDDNSDQLAVLQLMESMEQIKRRVARGIPEMVSRLEYASDAFFQEIARGFFLPVCCIAVAALARIRVLLLHLGSEIVRTWDAHDWTQRIKDIIATKSKNDPTVAWDTVQVKELKEFFRRSLAIVQTDNNLRQGGNNFSGTSTKQQALELVTELLEGKASKETKVPPQQQTTLPSETTANSDFDSSAIPSSQGDDVMGAPSISLDVGEPVSLNKGIEKVNASDNSAAPDYMQIAINQVQSNSTLTKKAKKQKRKASSISSTSPTRTRTTTTTTTITLDEIGTGMLIKAPDGTMARNAKPNKSNDTVAASNRATAHEEEETQSNSKTETLKTTKKKKRKDGSKASTSSKKSKKSSGDFFDNLFSK
jgi:hypothetical protein